MDRRKFLEGLACSALAAPFWANRARAGVGDYSRLPAPDPARRAVYLIPGYRQADIFMNGRPARQQRKLMANIPRDYRANLTLVTKIDEATGAVARTFLPVRGHDIAVAGDNRRAVFVAQDGPTLVSFDIDTLEIDVFHEYDTETRGGGHGVYFNGDAEIAICERKPYAPYAGDPAAHFGWLTIRDSKTLQELARYDCRGVAPHEVNIMADGAHLAISSYGSTLWPEGAQGPHRYVVEPSIVIMELASGKVLDKLTVERPASEYRHLAGYARDRIFVMQNAATAFSRVRAEFADRDEPVEFDFLGDSAGEKAQPVIHAKFGETATETTFLQSEKSSDMVRGQSIIYDPAHDEVLATYTTSQTVVVFDGATGTFKKALRTDLHGLELPRGIVLHPDGIHYAVAGERRGVYLFRRGTHELVRDRCFYEATFGHAHISVA
ncbi:MAG: hypothetical protein Tsb0010_13000 [Parvularculaceae bacterium]